MADDEDDDGNGASTAKPAAQAAPLRAGGSAGKKKNKKKDWKLVHAKKVVKGKAKDLAFDSPLSQATTEEERADGFPERCREAGCVRDGRCCTQL